MNKFKANANKFFSAGLGKGGRTASWLVAIGGLAAYTYWTNRDNGEIFTKEEQLKWNAAKEAKSKSSDKQ
ncbi:hypothetical protein IV203_031416 [Nitzschia inconspicua]|uniref:Uncharacterized protein n=1 Tax=Nitzschia inconspicua TaxID=303405 RepID=A0A9K3LVA9_9STRA|nr:hypothetical protein IV203_031416 [Nitzschia inconspicua]